MLDTISNSSAVLLARTSSGEIAGYVMLKILDPGPASTDGTMLKGKVEELFVAEEYRGHAIGSLLMNAAEGWFDERSVPRYVVEAYIWNTAAIEFYKRRGYETTDVILSRWR